MAVALIVAAGSGERLGADRPKAFVVLAGRPMLQWSVDALRACPAITQIVVALPAGEQAPEGTIGVAGAAVRSGSVRAALEASSGDPVLVHDAARPLVTAELAADVLAALGDGCDAAIAASPVTDTIKRAGDGRLVAETLDRSRLWAVQTPQAFRREALERALDVGDDVLAAATDDAWLVERAGGTVRIVPGPRRELQDHLLRRPAAGRAAARGALCSPTTTSTCARTSPAPTPSATSRPPTPSATARRPPSAGSPSWASPSTSTASRRRSTSGQHPWWVDQAHDDVDAYCEFVRGETDLRLGIEADFIAGREDATATFLEARDWDYVVGSVHFLRDDAVDHEGWDIWTTRGDPEKVWRRYFETLGEAARSGLFDILAHPDLVKVWGARAARFPTATCAASTSSRWRGSPSPASRSRSRPPGCASRWARSTRRAAFLEMCLEAGSPVALSSDAHLPEHVGHAYDEALELLGDLGVGELCVFEGASGGWSRSGAAAVRVAADPSASATTRTASPSGGR